MNAAQVLLKHKEQILDNWLNKVNDEIPESDSHQRFFIRNNIPQLIDDLCHLLESPDDSYALHSSKSHGEKRSDFKNYSLMHVIREYRILKDVIFNIMDAHGKIRAEDRNRILLVIDRAIEQAGEAFFVARQHIQQEARTRAENVAENLQKEEVLRENFFSGITHDLKNPVINILAAADFLSEHELGQDIQTKMLNVIRTSAQRAEALIRDLLDINLIKSGNKLPLSPETCELNQVLSQATYSFKPEVQQRILIDLDEHQISGHWDPSLLIRAIDNLLQNAIKYGDSSSVIRLKASSQHADYVAVAVHNEGEPIPTEKQSSLFNRFYRVGGDRDNGWGLGLALVKGIMDAHQGKITVESSREHGTTFTLYIPRNLPEDNDNTRRLEKSEG